MSNTLKTASVLAFERKIDPSDAIMHAGRWDSRNDAAAWQPIQIREKSVRGTISNRLKAKDQDPAKLDASIANPNLQTVDVAALSPDADSLRLEFTVRVLAGAGRPSACNSAEYQAKLTQTVRSYVADHGFTEIANRYALNLANGRFLWRNRVGAESVEVNVARLVGGGVKQQWTFDGLSFDLRTADVANEDVRALGAVIADGLGGNDHTVLRVTAFARLGTGQEVFPSQELILDKGREGKKSKTLYGVAAGGIEIAAIHSQKIGNALRTIDTWYEQDGERPPIAIEPYGSVTTQGRAYRQPKKNQDFYSFLDDWLLKDKAPPVDQQHFVMAVLVRGGVFGEAG